jgi:hypothetical protein
VAQSARWIARGCGAEEQIERALGRYDVGRYAIQAIFDEGIGMNNIISEYQKWKQQGEDQGKAGDGVALPGIAG